MFAGISWIEWGLVIGGLGVLLLLGWLAARPFQAQNFGVRLYQQKRYAEAVEAFQSLLKRRLPAGLEADTRRRLADTLDVLGRPEEAAQERERANAASAGKVRDPLALATQGDLLKRQGRYDEACALYEHSLALLPSASAPGRALVMAKLALACHEAGRSAETISWAEASLRNAPVPDVRQVMHSMAGIGYSDQGHLEEAETHYRRALELAEGEGKPDKAAECLGLLAGLLHKQGRFEEAIATCHRAASVSTTPLHLDLTIESECLRDMGRFDEARAVRQKKRVGPGFDQPWVQQRIEALRALGAAWLEAAADQPDAALTCLEEARAGLKILSGSVWPPPPNSNNDKLGLWCDATEARIQAQRGQEVAARRLIAGVESRLSRFTGDRATVIGAYGQLGRAAFFLGDLDMSRAFWERYLELRPNPVYLPLAYFYLGETWLRLGETAQARAAFAQAVAPQIDSYDARRAQSRLNEME